MGKCKHGVDAKWCVLCRYEGSHRQDSDPEDVVKHMSRRNLGDSLIAREEEPDERD